MGRVQGTRVEQGSRQEPRMTATDGRQGKREDTAQDQLPLEKQ